MATIFGGRRNPEPRSGGKIVRDRRASSAANRTPYARPDSKPPEPVAENSENPNWLAGLIYPARIIATGAGKLLSTVFSTDSSTSSSSYEDSGSENDDDENDDDAMFQRNNQLNKEVIPLPTKSENKHLIEQLVMKETFSREECDELKKLIESRVVDGAGRWLNITTSRIFDVQASAAIAESKKWSQEKKSRSGSKLKQVVESEGGSPVDVAKSYMQARQARTSSQHTEYETPSPVGLHHPKEETPRSVFSSSLQPSELKSSLATGSWNILEEIRRVRSKATEELLATTASKNVDLSSYSLERKSRQDSLLNNQSEGETGERLHLLKPLSSALETNARLDSADRNGHRIPAPAETICEGSQNKTLHITPAVSVSKRNKDGDRNQVMEHKEVAADPTAKADIDEVTSDEKYISSAQDHVDEPRNAPAENGLPSTLSSLSAGLNVDLDSNPRTNNMDAINAEQGGGSSTPMQEHTGLQSEAASAEAPVIDAISLSSGSEDSSSMQKDDASEDPTWPDRRRRYAAAGATKTSPVAKRTRGHTRRTRRVR